MRVFVTGATGFVGSHVVRRLVDRGHEVHALVLEGDAREPTGPVHVVRGDLLRPDSYVAGLEAARPEACMHLGWYANPKDYLFHRVNVDLIGASAALGEKLVALGCKRFVGAGTCFEYDTSYGFLSEATTPLGPRHLYSTCKRAVHDILRYLTAASGMELVWARLFFLYGPHESPGRLVPAVIDSLLSGNEARVSSGEQIRDFMHIEDAATGLVHVLESQLVGPVNVATGNPVAVREVVRTIARQLGAEDRIAWGAIQPRPNDPSFVCADVAKLRSSGFTPRHDLESGLLDTIAWSRTCRKS